MTSHVRAVNLVVYALLFVGAFVLTLAQALAAVDAPAAPQEVTLAAKGHGWAITDAQGMTLYISKRDNVPGTSSCVEGCALAWPPYAAPENAITGNGWSVITRVDTIGENEVESLQWAYNDKPLYRYNVDQSPGDTYGEGSGLLWDMAFIEIPTPPGIQIETTLMGYVAADRHQKTLYAPQTEVDVASLCIETSCESDWSPVIAPRVARSIGEWSVVTRVDGLKQWAYNGQPLFRYSGDVLIQEAQGHEVQFDSEGNTMSAMVLEPRPPYPSWVTVHDTDAGEMLADLNSQTIYIWDPSKLFSAARQAVEGCELECLEEEWIPMFATETDVAPGGNWAIVTLSDGRRQWAYKGRGLFTNTRDKTQGSFLGYRHGGNRAWNVVMHSGKALQGTLRRP